MKTPARWLIALATFTVATLAVATFSLLAASAATRVGSLARSCCRWRRPERRQRPGSRSASMTRPG